MQASKKTTHFGLPIPTDFTFSGETYRTQSVLGVGGEGEIFLVTSGNKKFVVKKFHNPLTAKSNIEIALKLKKRGFNVLVPLDYDLVQGIVLYPYIGGLDVSMIIKSRTFSFASGPKLSISTDTSNYINEIYTQFFKNLSFDPTWVLSGDQFAENVILDLTNLQFIIIDSI